MSRKRPVAGTHEHSVAAATAVAQRVASFVVEVLLDAEGSVRRTSVLHVADNEQESWPSWEPNGLADFMARRFPPGTARREVAEAGLSDGLRLEDVEAASSGPGGGPPMLVEGGAFEVHATLDPGSPPPPLPIEYQAVVHAKTLGARERQRVGEVRGRLAAAERARLRVPALAPARGLYRLELDVTLGGGDARRRTAVSGGLLQVT